MLVAPARNGRRHGDLAGRRQGFEKLPYRSPFTFRNDQTYIKLVGFDLAGNGRLHRPIPNHGLYCDVAALNLERQPLEFDFVAHKSYACIEILNMPLDPLRHHQPIRQSHPSGDSPRFPVCVSPFDIKRELEITCLKPGFGYPFRQAGY